MQKNKFNNPFLECDSWKNKARLEAIESIKRREAEKQQQKIRDAVEVLSKRLPK